MCVWESHGRTVFEFVEYGMERLVWVFGFALGWGLLSRYVTGVLRVVVRASALSTSHSRSRKADVLLVIVCILVWVLVLKATRWHSYSCSQGLDFDLLTSSRLLL